MLRISIPLIQKYHRFVQVQKIEAQSPYTGL